nr:transposase (putative), gypsy type [Tanacetum cinerariifolium]
MVRDSVQLETAVNTISHEYLLEFTSEYGIPEMLRPELPGPRDRIVDFPEGKVGWMSFSKRPRKNTPQCYTKPLDSFKNWNNRFFWVDKRVFPTVVDWRTNASKDGMTVNGTYSVEAVRALDTHRRGLRPRNCCPKMPPPENVPATVAPGVGQAEKAVAAEPSVARESRKRGHDGVDANAPPKSLRRDHADLRPSGSSHGGKSLAAMQLCLDSNVFVSEGASADVSDPDPLSFADAPSHHPDDVASIAATGDPESENISSPVEVGSPGSDLVDHAAPSGYFSELRHMHNEEFLRQYNVNLARQVAMGSQLRLSPGARNKNLEALLEAEADMKRAAEDKSAGLVSGEEKLKAAFEEFKRYEDERVERRCAELDARLDALSIDFDEELYPHMLTAIVGRRWVVGYGLRLAMMKCAESLEMRQAFADVVIDVIDEILEEGFDALLEEGSIILHSIEGTLLEYEIFSEFDEFMAPADENSESDTKEP